MSAPGGVLRYRPCGACAALYDVDDPCSHMRVSVQLAPNVYRERGPLTATERKRLWRERRRQGLPPRPPGPPPLTDAERAERARIASERVRAVRRGD